PQPLGHDAVAIDLQQQMRATLQVESKHHLLLRQEVRPCRERLLAHEVRNHGQHPHQRYEQDEGGADWGRSKHGGWAVLRARAGRDQAGLLSLTGCDFERTSAIMERTTLTRVPWAISTSRSSPSTALVTLPMMPPVVTTVSPRVIAASICCCCFMRFCCGRKMRSQKMTTSRRIGISEVKMSIAPASPAAWA